MFERGYLMRVVVYDKKSESMDVYNASAVLFNADMLILSLKHGTGYFPMKRFRFMGIDEKGLLDT